VKEEAGQVQERGEIFERRLHGDEELLKGRIESKRKSPLQAAESNRGPFSS
jgi:hypothetical protein